MPNVESKTAPIDTLKWATYNATKILRQWHPACHAGEQQEHVQASQRVAEVEAELAQSTAAVVRLRRQLASSAKQVEEAQGRSNKAVTAKHKTQAQVCPLLLDSIRECRSSSCLLARVHAAELACNSAGT